MRPLRRWRELTRVDRRLLIEAWVLLWGIKAAFLILPFRVVYRRIKAFVAPQQGIQEDQQSAERRVIWAIHAIARHTPWRLTCLERAMAGLVLAKRLGCVVELHIGIARGTHDVFQAHAWLEGASGVMLGGVDAPSRYVTLPPIEDYAKYPGNAKAWPCRSPKRKEVTR